MQLFTRNILMTGAPAEYMEYSTTMCGYVSDKIGREVSLWSNVFGAPIGSMTYSMRVEGLADLQTITTTLLGDADYHAKLGEGAAMIAAPAVDGLATPIHGELGDPPPVGSVAMVTTATMAAGQYVAGIGWGVEIAQHVEKISGVPMMFLMSSFGGFGDVAWIGVMADAAAADTANAAINADADYITMVDAGGHHFVESSGHQSFITRIA